MIFFIYKISRSSKLTKNKSKTNPEEFYYPKQYHHSDITELHNYNLNSNSNMLCFLNKHLQRKCMYRKKKMYV